RTGEAVALPRLPRAGGIARGIIFGTQAHAVAGQRIGHRYGTAEQRTQADVGAAVLGYLRVRVLARLGLLIERNGDDVAHPVGLAVVEEVCLETRLIDGTVVLRSRQWRSRQHRRVIGVVRLG